MLYKLIKQTTLTLAIISSPLLFFSPTKVFANDCTTPNSVGTLSVGRNAVEVGWSIPSGTTDIQEFQVAYSKAEAPSFGNFVSVPSDNFVEVGGSKNYYYKFENLEENTTYYWSLRTICNPATDKNADQLSGFITKPTLDVTGFLLIDGQIYLSRRIEVKSDFSYLRNPIFDVLTTSVGSGRLHVVSID